MKKAFVSICLLTAMLFSLFGCGYQPGKGLASDTAASLWIVTEETVADGMNQQAQVILDRFTERYPKISLRLDILPTEENERAAYLEELRRLMDEGSGPDLYLLPTSPVLNLGQRGQYDTLRVEPLFPDVNAAMTAGRFLDIRKFYDKDKSLGKDALNAVVMDAGVVDGARYTLPLRYNMPILYEWDGYFGKGGIDPAVMDGGITQWMEYAISSGDQVQACGAEWVKLDAFSQVIDYGKGEVLLDHQEAKAFLETVQKLETLVGRAANHRSAASLYGYVGQWYEPFPIQIGGLGQSLAYVAVAKAENRILNMYPVRTTDGKYMATVTYYAAIGKDCQAPEAAYELVREFLLEDAQWEKSRLKPEGEQFGGLLMNSYPVRFKGAVEPLWENLHKQVNAERVSGEEFAARRETILDMTMGESDLPILEAKLDGARYPAPEVLGVFSELNDSANGNRPTEANLDELADRLIASLESVLS